MSSENGDEKRDERVELAEPLNALILQIFLSFFVTVSLHAVKTKVSSAEPRVALLIA